MKNYKVYYEVESKDKEIEDYSFKGEFKVNFDETLEVDLEDYLNQGIEDVFEKYETTPCPINWNISQIEKLGSWSSYFENNFLRVYVDVEQI